jgi:hypothetical protein
MRRKEENCSTEHNQIHLRTEFTIEEEKIEELRNWYSI